MFMLLRKPKLFLHLPHCAALHLPGTRLLSLRSKIIILKVKPEKTMGVL